jgi:hypothetical protein
VTSLGIELAPFRLVAYSEPLAVIWAHITHKFGEMCHIPRDASSHPLCTSQHKYNLLETSKLAPPTQEMTVNAAWTLQVKVQLCLCSSSEGVWGGVEVWIHAFLTMALVVSFTLLPLYPLDRAPCTHCVGPTTRRREHC